MHKLTIRDWNTEKTMELEFDNDSNVSGMKDIFKTIMVFLTFSHNLDFLDIDDD